MSTTPTRARPRGRIRAMIALVVSAVATAVAVAALPSPASAASLVAVSNFGANPTGLGMHVYVPDNIPSGTKPAVLVAVHYCTGSGPAFYSGTQFASLADQYKFIVIYPTATRSGSCFDVSSPGALRHNGTSDPVGIVSMVNWVVANRNGDANRVYVTGASSGGMMTNVLLGDYPDVFKAGAAFMGVPFGCFATTDGSMWNSQCSGGTRIMTAQQWGDLVRNAYPGYTGARPRMQVFHGTTDTTLRYPNFGEEIKQWTNVLGVSQTPASTDTPQSGWTRTRYGATGTMAPVEAISVANVGHSLPLSGQAAMAIAFFGLNSTTPPPTSSPTTSPTTTPTTSPTTPPATTQPPSGSCTATLRDGTRWSDRFNTEVTVTGATNWTVVLALTSPQTVSSTWNSTYTYNASTRLVTVRPNGNGNVFGMTTLANGNFTRPQVRSCTSS